MLLNEKTFGTDQIIIMNPRTRQIVRMVKEVDTEKKTITRLVPKEESPGFDEVTESLEPYEILRKVWP